MSHLAMIGAITGGFGQTATAAGHAGRTIGMLDGTLAPDETVTVHAPQPGALAR